MRDAQSDDSNVTPHVSIPVVRRVFKHEETLSVFNKKSLVSRDIINYKASVFLQFDPAVNFKAGVIRDDTAVGRAAQAAGSLLLPGDTTRFTSPRSAAFGLITPGGGGGGRLGRGIGGGGLGPGVIAGSVRRARRAQLRCPAGYENGGRFATSGFNNCGRILFEMPNSRLAGLLDLNRPFLRAPISEADMTTLGGGTLASQTIQIQRNAQIPRVAGPDPKKLKRAFDGIVSVIEKNPNARFMARRDGFILAPAVTSTVLAGVRKSPDMEGAVFFAGAPSPTNLGIEHAPLIWQNKVNAVNNILPGGGLVTLEATRNLTNGDRRRLGRLWAQKVSRDSKPFDGGDKLREIADLSNGALTYRESIPGIDNANDLVTATRGKEKIQVRKWVFEKYLAAKAPGLTDGSTPWESSAVAKQSARTATEKEINNIDDAVAHLNSGGSLADIPPNLLSQALAKSNKYKMSKGKNRTTLYDGGRANKWIKTPAKDDFEHLSRRVSSDFQNAIGLEAGRVLALGEGEMRDSLIEDPSNVVDGRMIPDSLVNGNKADLMILAMSDFLLDNRGRTAENLSTASVGSKKRTFSTGDSLAGGVGLTGEELRSRRVTVLGTWYDREGAAYRDVFTDVSAKQRQTLVEIYNDTIKRAESFRWEEYMKRLLVDGKLTKPEQVRLEVMKDVFTRRLSNLRSSKTRLYEFVGLSE